MKELTCLEYALTFWNKNRDFKIYYNSNHVINLEKDVSPPKGYLELNKFDLNHLVNSFYDREKLLGFHLYIHLLGLYFEKETPEQIIKGIDFSKFNKH